ncbi:MAG TPA: hypothetical protein VK149_07955 [Sideroxyarcus sp.]|nr:hypothetical protein [Sideroxyarcus sp.]
MNPLHATLKCIAKLGLILMMVASMSADAGWFGLFSGSEKWKEEVQLSDGRVIVVEREQLNESGGDEWALNRGGGKPKEYRIRFASQNETGKMIEWRSVKVDSFRWPEVPLVLDFIAGQPTIFTLVAEQGTNCCEVYSKYVYHHGSWREEPLPEQFDPHTNNLFYGNRKNMPSFLDLTEKAKRQSDSGYRRALKAVGPSRKVKVN